MIGLSTTAIGMRPIEEAISIYRQLQEPLQLEYLELAIGTENDLSKIPQDIPLVIHDRALYHNGKRLHFSLLETSTWKAYRELLKDRELLAISIHPPKLRESDVETVGFRRVAMELYFGCPVMLEVMPSPEYHNSRDSRVPNAPLLLDVSHINIWHQGDADQVERTVNELIPRAKGIHLSHNNGRADSHDLIPEGIWFESKVGDWAQTHFVTYESLPAAWGQFERLDKRRRS